MAIRSIRFLLFLKLPLYFSAFLGLASLLPADELEPNIPRTWVDASGEFQIQAKFLGLKMRLCCNGWMARYSGSRWIGWGRKTRNTSKPSSRQPPRWLRNCCRTRKKEP